MAQPKFLIGYSENYLKIIEIQTRVESEKVSIEGMKIDNLISESRNRAPVWSAKEFFKVESRLKEYAEKIKSIYEQIKKENDA